MLILLINIFSFVKSNSVNSVNIPFPGSIYEKKINIPLVGYQIIETEIITENHAYVRLDGLIKNEGSIKYITKNNKPLRNLNLSMLGKFENELNYIIKPSYNLRKIIKKYKIEITSLNYDYENDYIMFNLYVKLFNYKTCITMNRIN